MTVDPDLPKASILLVDDQPDGLLALQTTLEPLQQNLVLARSGKEALRLLLTRDFALVLLDVVMPDMDGFETAQLIRARERSRYTPIIFLTALSGGELPQLRAYAMGAVDYVLKPYEPEIVRSKAAVFIDLARKTELVRRQEQALRASQARDHERELAEALRAAEVEKARVRAEELQRAVQMRDEFLSMASHELRTPLTALKLNLEATKGRLEGGGGTVDLDGLKERLRRLDRGVNQLGSLIEQLLDVSSLSAGKLRLTLSETNLSEVVSEVLGRFQDQFERTATPVLTRLEPGVIGVWDPLRLDQVVTNLVSNALKYAPGRPIEVSVTGRSTEAVLSIRDHGAGIAPEHHDRIFERFERAAEQPKTQGGFGLGLWIVRQVVDALGGAVAVHSRSGEGATFTVRLPGRVSSGAGSLVARAAV